MSESIAEVKIKEIRDWLRKAQRLNIGQEVLIVFTPKCFLEIIDCVHDVYRAKEICGCCKYLCPGILEYYAYDEGNKVAVYKCDVCEGLCD